MLIFIGSVRMKKINKINNKDSGRRMQIMEFNKLSISIMLFVMLFTLLISLGLIQASNAYGASRNSLGARVAKDAMGDREELLVTYGKTMNITLSSNHMNRLYFREYRLSKIIGDLNLFEGKISDDGHNLFMSVKLPTDDEFNVALIFSNGQVVDLNIKLTLSKQPKIIKFKFPGAKGEEELASIKAHGMLEDMANGNLSDDRYYLLPGNKKTIEFSKYLRGRIEAYCRSGDHVGLIIELVNKGKDRITLYETHLAKKIRNIEAIYLSKQHLKKGEKVKLYAVTVSRDKD